MRLSGDASIQWIKVSASDDIFLLFIQKRFHKSQRHSLTLYVGNQDSTSTAKQGFSIVTSFDFMLQRPVAYLGDCYSWQKYLILHIYRYIQLCFSSQSVLLSCVWQQAFSQTYSLLILFSILPVQKQTVLCYNISWGDTHYNFYYCNIFEISCSRPYMVIYPIESSFQLPYNDDFHCGFFFLHFLIIYVTYVSVQA